jgi:transposase InsO family protein
MPWKEPSIVSIREEFVLKALEPKASLAAICREYGISRKTGYKWLERYKKGGVLALRDLSRKPEKSPLAVSPELVTDIVAIKTARPRWGARKLIWALEQAGTKPVPSERTVNRILERCGMVKRRRVRLKHAVPIAKPSVTADAPNALWTTDYKGWWRVGDMKRCEPLTVRDQYSRFVLAVHVCRSPQIEEAMQLFERLFELHGIPKTILTDNGNPFVAPQSRFGLTRLSAWWVSLGIEHVRTRKATPSDNGGHERMHRDIAMEVEALCAPDLEQQQRACDLWRADFNNCRPHEALGMKPPAQVYKSNPATYSGKRIELVYPEHMLVRTVSGAGFFKLQGKMIPISIALTGFSIGIDPTSGPPYDIWFAHRKLGTVNPHDKRPVIEAALPQVLDPGVTRANKEEDTNVIT